MKRHLNTDKLLGNVFLSPTKRNNHGPCWHNSPALKRPKQQTNRRTRKKYILQALGSEYIYIYNFFCFDTQHFTVKEMWAEHNAYPKRRNYWNWQLCVPQTKTSIWVFGFPCLGRERPPPPALPVILVERAQPAPHTYFRIASWEIGLI